MVILYKYLSEERVDVLETLQLRFTQLHDLNDRFEAHFQLEPMERERERAKEDNYHAESAQVELFVSHKMGAVGVLCLSRKPDNDAMWANYASDGRGFAIGINDSPNPFVGDAFLWSDYGTKIDLTSIRGFGTFRDVVYSDIPIQIPFGGDVPFDACFTKKLLWSYEEEVRVFRSIYDASRVIGQDGNRCYLFDVPEWAVARIIVGDRASENLKVAALTASKRLELPYCRVEQVVPQYRDGRLEPRPIDD